MNGRRGDESDRRADYLAGTLGPEERAALEREILASRELSEEIYAQTSLAAALSAKAQPDARPSSLRTHSRRRPGRAWQWGLSLAVPAAAVLAFVLLRGPAPDPASLTDPVFRSDRFVTLLEPTGPMDAFPRLFRWSAHPEAARYRFELFDLRGQRLHSALTTQTFLELPEEMFDGRDLPEAAMWKVVPLSSAGLELSASAVERFEIDPQ